MKLAFEGEHQGSVDWAILVTLEHYEQALELSPGDSTDLMTKDFGTVNIEYLEQDGIESSYGLTPYEFTFETPSIEESFRLGFDAVMTIQYPEVEYEITEEEE